MSAQNILPNLSPEEIRVLGVLMEKSKTTPEYYPLTLNALTIACNQKTSRKPIVEYDEETVVLTLDGLKKKSLVSTVIGGGSRSVKYKHNLAIVFPLLPEEVAVLCLLFLRGSLTPGEINSSSGRLHEFESLEEVIRVLEKLADNEPPYVLHLPKRPGQKEARYAHLFAEVNDNEEDHLPEEPARKNVSNLESRLTIVEEELALMKEKVDKLLKELLG